MGEDNRDVVYAGSSGMENSGALAKSDAQRAIAEVQASMMIARMNPRDQVRAVDRIVNSCQRLKLAEAATYAYPRGNTTVSGPSIRLAEAIAQGWGNIRFGIREIEQRNGESTVQAYAWDVETNTLREVTFQVRHKRDTKDGGKILTEGRDIYEHVANQAARRVRACILGVIPGDVVETALDECKKTLTTKGVATPDQIQKMVATFQSEHKVTRAQIEARIGCRVEAIQPAQYVALRAVYTALRDNFGKVEDYFDVVDTAPPAKSGVDEMKQAAQAAAERRKASAASNGHPEPATTGEQQSPPPPADTPPQQDVAPEASRADVLRECATYMGLDTRRFNNLLRVLTKGACKDITKINDLKEDAYLALMRHLSVLRSGLDVLAESNIVDDQAVQNKWAEWSSNSIMSIGNLASFTSYDEVDRIMDTLVEAISHEITQG